MEKDDYIGQKFGKLTVLKLDEERNRKEYRRWKNGEIKHKPLAYYIVKCDCGKQTSVQINWMKRGNTLSCGSCDRDELRDFTRKKNEYVFHETYGECYLSNCDECVLFDLEDYDKIKDYTWSKNKNGYAEARFSNRKLHSMHKFLIDDDKRGFKFRIDHINQNKLDNRKENLRIVTTSQNSMNMKLPKTNKTGVIGVSPNGSKYRAYITKDGKRIELGNYINIEDAIVARLKAEKELFGEYSGQKHLFEKYNI